MSTPTSQKPSAPDLITLPPRLHLLSILQTVREGRHLLDRDNDRSKSYPAQLDVGPQGLERVPQGISPYLPAVGESFLLSDLHPFCFNYDPFISNKLSPVPPAWPRCLRSHRRKSPQISLQRLGLAQGPHSIHCCLNLQEEGKREGIAALQAPFASLPPSGTAHGLPAQLVCCLGLPLLPHPPGANPQGTQILP